VAWPSPRFTDHGNGTVTDNLTGLIWLKDGTCVEGAGTSTWANALTFVNSLQTGQCGLSDGNSAGQWRLPNVNEIQSLAHTGMWEIGNWLNKQGFTGVERGWYWSSTTFPGDTKKLWDMNFIDGHRRRQRHLRRRRAGHRQGGLLGHVGKPDHCKQSHQQRDRRRLIHQRHHRPFPLYHLPCPGLRH
jgi:hypothetical protein